MAETDPSRLVADTPASSGQARSHLLKSPEGAALLRLEFASMRMSDAFATWVKDAHHRAGGPPLRFTEIFLLHCVRLCGADQTVSELRLFTNAYALPRVQDGLRTLIRTGLVKSKKSGGSKELTYSLTQLGEELTGRYAGVREKALVDLCKSEIDIVSAIEGASSLLERVVGLYRLASQRLADQDFLHHDTEELHTARRRQTGTKEPGRTRRKPARKAKQTNA